MKYPQISSHITYDDLVVYFTLTQDERYLLSQCRKDMTILGFAILLKTFQYLGYPPILKKNIPEVVVSFISGQLNIDSTLFKNYTWKNSVWKTHLGIIRKYTGFSSIKRDDFYKLERWLIEEGRSHPSRSQMYSSVIQRCRELHIELPKELELQRLVNSAWQKYLSIICENISKNLGPRFYKKIDDCLEKDSNGINRYTWMKSNPGKHGIKTLFNEIERLKYVQEFGIRFEDHFIGVPEKILKLLWERSLPEDPTQMKRHIPHTKYAMMDVLLHYLSLKLTDNVAKIFTNLIRRIEKKSDKALEQALIKTIKKVYKKKELLYKVAKASTESPHETVENVIFPVVGKEIFNQIISEFEGQDLSYKNNQAKERKKKYSRSYRRMLKPVLETLVFRTSNPVYTPILDGLAIIQKYLESKHSYYPESETDKIPLKLLKNVPEELWADKKKGKTRIIKHYFELCVLQKLEKALKNKEIWVEGSFEYRNPDADLPNDWKEKQIYYCNKHKIPDKAEDLLAPIQEEMRSEVAKADSFFSEKHDVYIYYPGNGDKGLFRIPKIEKSPEHPILKTLKQKAIERWGILDLTDILLEADRQVNFTRYFYSTAQRHVLSADEIRERLLLSILGRGTGLGLKRIHAAAKPNFSYDDLYYFNKRFFHIDSVRETIAVLVNRIIEIRSPEIWKNSTTCTSDGKYLGAWEQNLVAQWNPHYQETGIMSYFLVDENSTGIHSQVKRGTEVSAMITSLIQHDTMMTIKANCIDSHGQSELGFAFCRFLYVELLPWLKRMKYERLYLPESGTKGLYPNLSGVLARPINWDLPHEHYNDMARHVVAAKEKTAPVDSLLRRFNRNNPANQTYKGFLEIGKALKTIHNCKFLTDPSYRHRIFKGRNIVENWNSAIDVICFGGKSEIQSNNPEIQELTVLCLHLLQNALVLVNTLMVERVLFEDKYIDKVDKDDINSITPLFTSNVNPYGDINLDIYKPSFLEIN